MHFNVIFRATFEIIPFALGAFFPGNRRGSKVKTKLDMAPHCRK